MNLLLLAAGEIDARGEAVLDDRRSRHLVDVLRAAPGQRVRAGQIDGPLGHAEILRVEGSRVAVRCTLDEQPPAVGSDALLLAVPRPKVLGRCLSLAASLGFARILLFRSWRVDRSHLQSRALEPATIREALVEGLELSRRTRVPDCRVFPLFRPFVEDRCDELVPRGARFVADPGATSETAALRLEPGAPFALAVGPEGGFTEFELRAFARVGFAPVRHTPHPLRVEAAVALLAGQLDLLRRRAAR